MLRIAFVLAVTLPSLASGQDLTIHHLDVGTGDATLLVMPSGASLLVDAGLHGAGANVVVPFLQAQNITTLDAFVLTHYDSDHMGGTDRLIEAGTGITVTAWFDRGQWQHLPTSKRNGTQFLQYETAANVQPTPLQPGDRLDLDPAVTITVVAVNGHVRGAVGPSGRPVLNVISCAEIGVGGHLVRQP